MSTLFPLLFEPGKIGSLELGNRIVKAPTSTGMSNKDGTVSERLIRHYRGQASGGVGLLIVEYAFIDDDASKSAHCQVGISTDEHIAGLAWLAEVIKEQGAKAAIQLEHCGRQKFLGTQPIKAASAVPWPSLKQQKGDAAIPSELSQEEISGIVDAFGKSALRAKRAGFNLIEIHGAHGYLITNFLSPHTNKRTDKYGGNLQNRMRFMLEVIDSVRSYVGAEFPVTIRLSGSDYEPDGFSVDETIIVAQAAEQHGMDAIHVSGGDHHQMIHQVSPMVIERGHNVWAAEAIRPEVNIPIIASGSITLPQQAEDILTASKADFISLGRPLWADPSWPNKAREGRPEDIVPCIRCNDGCLDRTFFNYQAVSCSVNPSIGREGDLDIRPASKPIRVAVVGGGVAGMEAARILKLRGHDVTIFEQRDFLGGVGVEGSVADFKSDYRFFLDYQIQQVKSLNIRVIHNKATTDKLQNYDAAVIATGGVSSRPPIPGINSDSVFDAVKIFLDDSGVGNKAIVLGGGETAVEAALYLEQRGRNIRLIHRREELMTQDVVITDKIGYSEKLAETTIAVTLSEQVTEIGDGWVTTKSRDGEQHRYEANTVVSALGFVARDDTLAEDLIKLGGIDVYTIGDRIKTGRVFDAIKMATLTALKI